MMLLRTRLFLLAALLLTGTAQLVAQDDVGNGGWQLERVLGRGDIEDLSVSPDGKTLAVAGSRGVWLYSLPLLRDVAFFPTDKSLRRVKWAPDGKWLVLLDTSGMVTLCDTDCGMNVDAFLQADDVAWAPDGQALALAARNRIYILPLESLLQRETGTERLEIPLGFDVYRMHWSANPQRLYIIDQEERLMEVRDVTTGESLSRWEGQAGYIDDAVWSPDGHLLVTEAGMDYQVRESFSGKLLEKLRRYSSILSLAWAPDGRRLASGGVDADGAILIHDTITGESYPTLYHRSSVDLLEWTPNGKLLSASRDGMVRLWDVEREHELANREMGGQGSFGWSPDGTRITISPSAFSIQIRDVESGEVQAGFYDSEGLYKHLWSPNGQYIALGSDAAMVVVLDSESGEPLVTHLLDWGHALYQLEWSPDSTRLLIMDVFSNVLEVRDAFTGESRTTEDMGFFLTDANWSPDATLIAISDFNGVIRLLDAESLDTLVVFDHGEMTRRLIWSPDGRHIASTGDLGLQVWDVVEERRVAGQTSGFPLQQHVSWSPDGKHLSFLLDGRLNIREIDNFSGVTELPPGQDEFGKSVSHWSWSPDGQHLALLTPRSVNVLRVQSLSDIQISAVLRDGNAWLTHVSWSPDGSRLATSGADGLVRIWRAPEDD